MNETALDDAFSADLSPAETLALVDGQRRKVDEALGVDPRLLYGVWGLAWSVGFATFWRTAGGPEGAYQRPALWVGILFGLLILGAIVVTAVHSSRASRGVRGASAEVGAMYGWAWFLGFAGYAALFVGMARAGASEELQALLAPSASCLLVGVLYLAGGAVWRDRVQFGLGGWIVAVTAAGAVVGLPGIYLVMSVAGGGGFLLAAAWFALQRWRAA